MNSSIVETPESLAGLLDPSLATRQEHRNATPLWIEEGIWGHRLYDSQGAWLTFLEFLTVAEAHVRSGELLQNDVPFPLIFRPGQRLYLRNLMFNSDDALREAAQVDGDDRQWTVFLERMQVQAIGLPDNRFDYLRTRFTNFRDFVDLIKILRSAGLGNSDAKRWSSQFVFPFGREAIYEDLDLSKGTPSRGYINFGRNGELIYQMLARSIHRDKLRGFVQEIVRGDERINKLLKLLQPDTPDNFQDRGKSVLPYRGHETYDRLGEDWLAMHACRLPRFDSYPHLATLAGLHLLHYHLLISSVWAGSQRPTLVCEIIAPKKTRVRQLSLESFNSNNNLSELALIRTFERLECSPRWQNASNSGYDAFSKCSTILLEAFKWGEDYAGASNPNDLLRAFRANAIERHRDRPKDFHRNMGRDIGLISRRGTNRSRYAPTDALIKTLVLVNVEGRAEFSTFLERLYQRYGLVIGEREAQLTLPDREFDADIFRDNARRLEERLNSLGLLKRLSDACAYVINPYARKA